MQADLFIAPAVARAPARRRDPATSHAAAARADEMRGDHHARILAALKDIGPAGKDRIGKRVGLSGVAVARRLSELEREGLARPTGDTEPSETGRAERRWRVVA